VKSAAMMTAEEGRGGNDTGVTADSQVHQTVRSRAAAWMRGASSLLTILVAVGYQTSGETSCVKYGRSSVMLVHWLYDTSLFTCRTADATCGMLRHDGRPDPSSTEVLVSVSYSKPPDRTSTSCTLFWKTSYEAQAATNCSTPFACPRAHVLPWTRLPA